MTEDIVKRLRERAETEAIADNISPTEHIDWMAAAEIEKLREIVDAFQMDGASAAEEIKKLRAANLILQDKYLRLQHKLGRIGQVLEEPCAAKAALDGDS